MAFADSFLGRYFAASQVSEGTATGGGPYVFTETKPFASQTAAGMPIGAGAMLTVDNVVYAPNGSASLTFSISNSPAYPNGTSFRAGLVGSDAGRFLVYNSNANFEGAGKTYLYITDSAAQQPGVSPANNTATVSAAPCFCEGTLIQTDHGAVAVEALAVGDRVLTVSGPFVPVRWVGLRRIVLARHPVRPEVQPVRIDAGAIGPGLPQRDLWLSPEHAVLLDNVLVPVRHLIGCVGIAVDAAVETTTYYHVELAHHDVLLAEGLPCESWLDMGNRAMFENALVAALSFDAASDAASAAADAYAPLLTHGPALDALRTRLGAAATQDLRVVATGRHSFTLPPGSGDVRIVSDAHQSGADVRRLGVAISAIALDGVPLGLTDARFGCGFFAVDTAWRWTDGAGYLTLGTSALPRVLTVDVTGVARPASQAA